MDVTLPVRSSDERTPFISARPAPMPAQRPDRSVFHIVAAGHVARWAPYRRRLPPPHGRAGARGRGATPSPLRPHAAPSGFHCRYGRRPCSRGFFPRPRSAQCHTSGVARSDGYTLRATWPAIWSANESPLPLAPAHPGGGGNLIARRSRHCQRTATQEATATRCASDRRGGVAVAVTAGRDVELPAGIVAEARHCARTGGL